MVDTVATLDCPSCTLLQLLMITQTITLILFTGVRKQYGKSGQRVKCLTNTGVECIINYNLQLVVVVNYKGNEGRKKADIQTGICF